MQNEIELFRAKVKAKPSGCWEWTGPFSKTGHPKFNFDNNKTLAHRWIYQLLVGDIEENYKLHHLCENPPCINPSHLTPVTQRLHMLLTLNNPARINRLKTHCIHGHEFTPAKTNIWLKNGFPMRSCLECNKSAVRRRNAKNRKIKNNMP